MKRARNPSPQFDLAYAKPETHRMKGSYPIPIRVKSTLDPQDQWCNIGNLEDGDEEVMIQKGTTSPRSIFPARLAGRNSSASSQVAVGQEHSSYGYMADEEHDTLQAAVCADQRVQRCVGLGGIEGKSYFHPAIIPINMFDRIKYPLFVVQSPANRGAQPLPFHFTSCHCLGDTYDGRYWTKVEWTRVHTRWARYNA
ncbi:hypothetical protein K438DRAFT_1778104 [Mycena galopus ATCC 62051]|nr:hypothetical protein K438DRAFT_1778104 [Mycena galopus ATCC 62051]